MTKIRRHTRTWIGFVTLAFGLIFVAPREALAIPAGSTGCVAVNAGVFDATVTPAMFSFSATQADFAVGDRLDFTITAGGHSHFILGASGMPLDSLVLGNETLLKSYTLTATQLTLTLELYADLFDDITVSATCASAAPTVIAIAPDSGTATGGTAVTITGIGFTGATAVTLGGVAASGVTVVDDGTITATTPAHAAGTVDVQVTTPSGTGTGAGLYTYIAAPTVGSISPSTGPVTGGTAVTLTGTNLSGATSVTIGGAAATFSVVNATTITATTPAHAAGAVNVVVTTPGGAGTGTGLFTYVDGPTVTGIAPATGPTAGSTPVTITGSSLTGATSVTFGGVAATAVVVVNATTLTATTPAHAAGVVNVVVTTPGGAGTGTGLYTYADGPTITAIHPSSGPADGGTAIVIKGTNLAGATTLRIGGEPATFTAVDSSTVTATTPAHAAGVVDVVITTAAGSGTGTFTYIATLTLTSTASPATQVNEPYSQANVASGGTPPYRYSVSAGSLPSGVALDDSTGLVSGTPSALGAFSYTIQVTDSGSTPLTARQAISGTIAPILTTIALTSSQNPSLMGERVTLTATISPAPAAGTVRFDDGGTTVCDAMPLAGGTATCVAAFSTAGAHSMTAIYSGSAAHGASTSAALMQTVSDQRVRTVEAIGKFMSRRNDLLAANQPDASRQIDRLIEVGSATSANGAAELPSAPAPQRAAGLGRLPIRLAPPDGHGGGSVSLASGPVRASASANGPLQFALATSLRQVLRQVAGAGQASGSPAAAPSPLDVWVDGTYGSFRDTRANNDLDGHFGLVSVGTDYVLGRSLLVGGMVQFDTMRQRSALEVSESSGHGWLAGPYATVRLTDQVFLQARAGWGRTTNDVSPLDTYTDEFGSNRWLFSSTVAGRLARGSWVLRPAASVTYVEDATRGYRDTFGIAIPEVTSRLGQARLGPQVEYRRRVSPGVALEPHGGLQIVANFAGSTTADGLGQIDGVNVGPAGVRGRAELGTRVIGSGRFDLDVSGSYDGIGTGDYPAFGGRITVRVPLP